MRQMATKQRQPEHQNNYAINRLGPGWGGRTRTSEWRNQNPPGSHYPSMRIPKNHGNSTSMGTRGYRIFRNAGIRCPRISLYEEPRPPWRSGAGFRPARQPAEEFRAAGNGGSGGPFRSFPARTLVRGPTTRIPLYFARFKGIKKLSRFSHGPKIRPCSGCPRLCSSALGAIVLLMSAPGGSRHGRQTRIYFTASYHLQICRISPIDDSVVPSRFLLDDVDAMVKTAVGDAA